MRILAFLLILSTTTLTQDSYIKFTHSGFNDIVTALELALEHTNDYDLLYSPNMTTSEILRARADMLEVRDKDMIYIERILSELKTIQENMK